MPRQIEKGVTPSSVSLPAWIGKGEIEISEFCVKKGGILVVLLQKSPTQNNTSGMAQAAYLTPEQAPVLLQMPGKQILAWLETSQCKIEDLYSFRLLGEKVGVEKLSSVISKLGITTGKHVDLVEPSTPVHFIPAEGRLRIPSGDTKTQVQSPPSNSVHSPHSSNSHNSHKKIRVLVVDDSETIRKLLHRVFSQDPEIECVGTIELPSLVDQAIQNLKPDVITLDIHMPEMDGVTLLKQIAPKYRIPTVMISSLSREEGTFVLEALESGAVDYIQKPSMQELPLLAPIICEKIKNASLAKMSAVRIQPRDPKTTQKRTQLFTGKIDASYLIAIGSSTGGTEALREVLTSLPEHIPPIVIVQHIPPIFSKAFADRMNQLCPFEVKEAQNGDIATPDRVLIAPGGKQMRLEGKGEFHRVVIEDTPPVNRHKPSVDVLFDSIAHLKRKKVVAGILTGMGGDGARGLLRLHETGAEVFAQDEASCVVYGMPKEAIRFVPSAKVLPLLEVSDFLIRCASLSTK